MLEKCVQNCLPCQSVQNAPAVAPLHPWLLSSMAAYTPRFCGSLLGANVHDCCRHPFQVVGNSGNEQYISQAYHYIVEKDVRCLWVASTSGQ